MKQYLDMCRHILANGDQRLDRTGTGTISTFGYQNRYNLQEGFPLMTTKKVALRIVLGELLWFIEGNTNIQALAKNRIRIWNDWPYAGYKKSSEYQGETMDEFIAKIINDDEFAAKWGNLGPVYGKQWREFGRKKNDQIKNIVETLKTNPNDRRLLCVAFNPDVLEEVALPPCHVMFQFYTYEMQPIERLAWLCEHSNGEYDEWKTTTHEKMDELNVPRHVLSCSFNMRSNDFCCGNPYNIAQYAMLTYMLCEVCNMVPGELVYNGGDVHVYTNHIEGAKEQLSRNGSEIIPKLKFARKINSIDDFKYEDFIIEDYHPDASIKYELNVGL